MTLPTGTDFSDLIDANGVWRQVFNPDQNAQRRGRPALFLDRDGVIVNEVNYLCRASDVRLIDGAARTIRAANDRAIPVIVVTNQAGIAYGRFEWSDFAAVQDRIISDLAKQGAQIDAVYACPHHKMGRAPYNHPDPPARKPNPGMLLSAHLDVGIDLTGSWIVGDRSGDLAAGQRAGLCCGVHVLTGHGMVEGEREIAEALATSAFRVRVANSISDVGAHLHHLDQAR